MQPREAGSVGRLFGDEVIVWLLLRSAADVFDKDNSVYPMSVLGLDPIGQEAFVNHVHLAGRRC